MQRLLAILTVSAVAALALGAYRHSVNTLDRTGHIEQAIVALAEIVDRDVRGEHVINPPEDGRRYATMLVTSENWQANAQERRLRAWFDSNPRLASLKSTTHYMPLTADNALWKTRYAPKYRGPLPMLRIQAWDGAVLYERAGTDLGFMTDYALVQDIESRISQCGPRPGPVDPKDEPDKAPWFVLKPQIHPTMHLTVGLFPWVMVALAILGAGLWYFLSPDENRPNPNGG